MVQLVQLVQMELQVHQEQVELLDQAEPRVQVVLQVHQELAEHQVLQEAQEHQVQVVLQVILVDI